MKSYINATYLVHFFNAMLNSEEFSTERHERKEIFDFFKSRTHLILDQDFEKILEKIEAPKRNVIATLINQLTSGRRGTTIKTNNSNMSYNMKKLDVYSKIKEPFASFWIDEKNVKHNSEKYMEVNPYYFISNENELGSWESFNRNESLFVGPHKSEHQEESLKSWDDFERQEHPFKDILIADRYCLKDRNRIRINLIPLFKSLAKYPEKVKNIMFFIQNKDQLFSHKEDDVMGFINEELIAAGFKNINLKIFFSYRAPHDRCIITNNKYITSGDSFDYFDVGNRYKTKGTTLNVDPIFEANRAELDAVLSLLKSIYKDSSEKNSIGNSSSNILDFDF